MDDRQKAEIARALAALRPRVQATCVVCDKPITGVRTRRYCSDACRVRAYRQRKIQRRLSEEESR